MDNECIGKRLAKAVRHGLKSCAVCCQGPDKSADPATRQRLLVQARHVFATKGPSVTVRDICRAANANVAAVSYHFGGKEGLMAEVLADHLNALLFNYPLNGGIPSSAPPEERLTGFLAAFLSRILLPTGRGDDAVLGQMLSDAFARPTLAFAPYADRHIMEIDAYLFPLIAELSGQPAEVTDEQSVMTATAIVSQVLFYSQFKEKLLTVRGGQVFTPEDIQMLAQHIQRFCLGGIKQAMEPISCANSME